MGLVDGLSVGRVCRLSVGCRWVVGGLSVGIVGGLSRVLS